MFNDHTLLSKLEINSPNCSKSIKFCFNKDQNKPLQLISYNESGGFTVNPDAQKYFDSLRDNNLGVITIVGKNRTGKSYLLNRVILNQNSGFSVGHTVNPCTKGIWVWPHVIEVENNNNQTEKLNVIVLDTEGTDATDQHENYDTKIFMLGMLLSSCLIYNSVGAIDEKAIQNLSLIVNLSKHLQKTNEKEFEDLMECFPSFLWVVRDFALKLIDAKGSPITSKEYLENALKEQKGFSEAIENKNRIRRLLGNFFKDRDCFLMVRPIEGEKDIQSLHKLQPEQLRPEFNDQVNNLKRKVWLKVKPKQFRGKAVNGPAFIVLCKLLCNMLNSGEMLSLDSTWNSICQIECEKILRELSDTYESKMQEELNKGKITPQSIGDLHKKVKGELMDTFKKRALGDNVKEFEGQFEEILRQKYQMIKKIFQSQIEARIKESIEEKLEVFENKINNQEFRSFSDFVIDFKLIKSDLDQEFTTPETHEVVLDCLLQFFFKAAENFHDDITSSFKQNDRLTQSEMESLRYKIASMDEKYESKVDEHVNSLRGFESERAKLQAEISSLADKLHTLEQQRSDNDGRNNVKVAELTREFRAKEAEMMSRFGELEEKYERVKQEKQDLLEENEKKIKAQGNQLEYKKEQIDSLNQTLTELKRELKQERQSHKTSMQAVEEIKKMMGMSANPLSRRQSREDDDERGDGHRKALEELLRENQELRKNIDVLNGRIESNVDEFYLQRNELENKLEEIERRYKEKQLQDEFALAALKKRVKNYESADMAMLETNKNLSIALERADTRCFNLEKKVDKIKKYHKMFKYAEEVVCRFCCKKVKKTLFMAHIEICNLNDDRLYESVNMSPNFNVTLENQFQNAMPNKSFKIEGNIGKQKCFVNKSFQDVRDFIQTMRGQLKNSEILPYLEDLLRLNQDRLSEENWANTRELLQEVIMSLAKLPQVRESAVFQDFFPMRSRDQVLGVTNRSTSSAEDMVLSSRNDNDNKVIFDNHDLSMKNKHLRKESNRYFSGKESVSNTLANGFRSKRNMQINPDLGTYNDYEN